MKDNGNNTNQKAGWMIGIALIIFLILLGGSIIGLKLVRDNAEKFGQISILPGKFKDDSDNYDVLEDGTKVNISTAITEANIDKDGIVFNKFSITESIDNLSETDSSIWCDIDFTIRNTTNENIANKIYIMSFYDSNDEVITEFSINIESLEAGEEKEYRETLTTEVARAASVKIGSMTLGFEE